MYRYLSYSSHLKVVRVPNLELLLSGHCFIPVLSWCMERKCPLQLYYSSHDLPWLSKPLIPLIYSTTDHYKLRAPPCPLTDPV